MTALMTPRERLERDLARDPGILIIAYPYARTWGEIPQDAVRDSWANVEEGQASALYVHVPFCQKKCTYCDFLAYYGRPDTDIGRYVELLRQEIRQVAQVAGHVTVESMEFGGGTPSLLGGDQVTVLMNDLKNCFRFSPSAQITMEVFPDDRITKDLMKDWWRAGINRLTFGVQSLDDGLKRAMNRTDTATDILRILQQAREAGFDDFNVDLICGLPDQTDQSWQDTYREILRLRPTHICVFPVSVRHEGIALYRKRATLPPPSRSRLMYESARMELAQAGYERTTRHNFRLQQYDCTYERMMAQLTPVIGLGAHAVSQSKDCIYKNHSHLAKYEGQVSRGELAVLTGHVFPPYERLNNYAVRKVEYLHLDGKEFAGQFGMRLTDVFSQEIALLDEFGLVRMNGDDMELTPDGVYYTAAVKRTFFHPSAWERFAKMQPGDFQIERGVFGEVSELAGALK